MLPHDTLISPILSHNALLIAGDDKSFSFYVHYIPGPTLVSQGTAHSQVINTTKPSDRFINHLKRQFQRISLVVDIQFAQVSDPDKADLIFYNSSTINLGSSDETTLGHTLFNLDPYLGRQWTELFFNSSALSTSTLVNIDHYVFNHELLHALGLEHTFDDSDGDYYLSIDPQLGATPEDTAMSYRLPDSLSYSDDITESDYNALIQIWGHAQNQSNLTTQPSPVHRLYDSLTGNYLFSANLGEIDIITGTPSFNFVDEGVAYTVGVGANQDVYRFFNSLTGHHLYTANTSERDLLINASDSAFIYEGIAFSVFSVDAPPIVSIPVYRYYDAHRNVHFYTANDYERVNLELSYPHWINEGIAWYA